MTFDPFGDRETRGYLRNRLGTNDATLISRLEAHAFSANVHPALAALQTASTVSHDQVLDTHRRLLNSVYPWAEQGSNLFGTVDHVPVTFSGTNYGYNL